jgi:hypothetical protein
MALRIGGNLLTCSREAGGVLAPAGPQAINGIVRGVALKSSDDGGRR